MMLKKNFDNSKIKILVCCHKECQLPTDKVLLPIQVGSSISDTHWGIQRDDQINGETCDNISAKNKSYCELTAIYWAWKNIKTLYPDIEYVGLTHYRRFFNFQKNIYNVYKYSETAIDDYKINHKKLNNLLKRYECLLPSRTVLPYSLKTGYCVGHISDDYRILRATIAEIMPEQLNFFNFVMEETNLFSQYNMFIMKIDDFMNYCEWLFKILFLVEEKIDISSYSLYQKRIYGFMAERLMNLWVFNNIKKIHCIPVSMYDKNLDSDESLCRDIKNKVSFFISLRTQVQIKNILAKSHFGKLLMHKIWKHKR